MSILLNISLEQGQSVLVPALGLLIIFYVLWSVYVYFSLSHIPGPWVAGWTNLARLWWVWRGRSHLDFLELHRRYGPLVRLGPNTVSVSDPTEIPNIYNFTGTFTKSNFYSCLGPYHRGKAIPMLFTTQDEVMHKQLRRPIASVYNMTNLIGVEPYVDSTIDFLFKKLDSEYANKGNTCDLSILLQHFAFDVMGEVTVSKRLGFLAEEEGVRGLPESIWDHFQYAAVVGQMPWLDKVFKKNPVIGYFRTVQPIAIIRYTFEQMALRQKLLQEKGADSVASTEEGIASPDKDRRDMMSRFFEAKMKDPSVPEMAAAAWSISNIAAGSDTTAITLRTIVYNLLRKPSSMAALMSEIHQAQEAGQLSEPVTWHEARTLPYLDACIKEAGRIHPAFGLPLERIVPDQGASICGSSLPAGTIVGVQMWAAHRNEAIFGPEVDEWRPERWLVDEPTRRTMENALLTFGHGNRSCIGKNIALLEIYKLIPSLFQRYSFDLQHSDWTVESAWFVHQRNLDVKLSHREKSE